jgi:hypothetical protein
LHIHGPIIKERAKEVAKKLGKSDARGINQFSYSNYGNVIT